MNNIVFLIIIIVLLLIICGLIAVIYLSNKHIKKRELELVDQKIALEDGRAKLMLAQLKPHFVSNTMSAIRAQIMTSPDDAVETLDYFVSFFREAIELLDTEGLVKADIELEFTKNYLYLQKSRFNEGLIYHINVEDTNFFIPPLSIQPLVENAIHHGIRGKRSGTGVINIKIYSDDSYYLIDIIDDGIGFDPNNIINDDRTHIGLNTVKYRLESMVGGLMQINSAPGKGTTITLSIPKVE